MRLAAIESPPRDRVATPVGSEHAAGGDPEDERACNPENDAGRNPEPPSHVQIVASAADGVPWISRPWRAIEDRTMEMTNS